MSALGTCDHAIGTDNDVTVKVYVNLKRRKDHEIQLIDISALVERFAYSDAEISKWFGFVLMDSMAP